jgi:hypothetical protein
MIDRPHGAASATSGEAQAERPTYRRVEWALRTEV